MLKIKIGKLNYPLFKEALKRAKDINENEIIFRVLPNELQFGAFSPSNVEAVVVRASSMFFEEGGFINDSPEKEISFAVNPRIFDRVVSRFKEGEIAFDGQLQFSVGKRKFVLPSYMPEQSFPEGLIDVSYENTLSIPNDFITEAIRDMQVDNFTAYSAVTFALLEKKLTVSRSTEYVPTAENTINVENDNELIVSTNLDSFGKIVVGLARRAEVTKLELEDKKPVIIKYVFPEGMQLHFALSPHQEEEEYELHSDEEYDEDTENDEDETVSL